MNNKVKILCCYYKENIFIPKNDIYIPIQCGKAATGLNLGILGDDTEDNISLRNRYWSEITGLYWAWKNLRGFEYIGLCSYRRFFDFNFSPFAPITKIRPKAQFKEVDSIKFPDIPKLLSKYDIIVPKKYFYAYNLWNVLRMNYYTEDFFVLKNIILRKYPDYEQAFEYCTKKRNFVYGHNMFIMSNRNFLKYCNWVFDILLQAEKEIDPKGYPIDKVRVFGYMHEFLLTLYIFKNRLKVKESQLLWITDERTHFNFNSVLYRIAAKCSFFFNKPRGVL